MSKVLEWIDEQGLPRLSRVPDDAGIDDAPYGIPVSYDLERLPYEEPFRSRLYLALWEEGFKTVEEFQRIDALDRIHRVVRRLVKYDANDIRQSILAGVGDDSN